MLRILRDKIIQTMVLFIALGLGICTGIVMYGAHTERLYTENVKYTVERKEESEEIHKLKVAYLETAKTKAIPVTILSEPVQVVTDVPVVASVTTIKEPEKVLSTQKVVPKEQKTVSRQKERKKIVNSFRPEDKALVKAEAAKYGIWYTLAMGTIDAESGFDPNAVGINRDEAGNVTSKDEGLFQINNAPGNAEWYASLAGLKTFNVFDPKDNIKMGMAGLNYYLNVWEAEGYSGTELEIRALNSYNMGLSGYKNYLKKNPISRGYDKKVHAAEKNVIPE